MTAAYSSMGATPKRNGADAYPGQWWLDGLLIAGASSEAEARAILADLQDPADAPVPQAAIKAEARRRILTLLPAHRQRNMLAAALEAQALYGPDPAHWPEELRARHLADLAAWTQINAIRAASNALLASDPPPADYTADRHWPERLAPA